MPLIKTCSADAFRTNVAAEIRAGKPANQAAAIAHDTLRTACKEAGKSVPRTDADEPGLQVRRYDTGEFTSPTRTPNGYLRCDAKITRIGVFSYRQADGSTRKELRLPDEVFNDDSLSSFEDVPLTNNHPKERLTEKNTRRFQAGNVKRVRKHDEFVSAKVLITDNDAINDAENGKTQLSCGYTCDLDLTPGVTSGIDGVRDGLRYDAIQRNIVGNHVAIVNKARAGTESQLHLDAEDAVMVVDTTPKPNNGPRPNGDKPMKTVRIDGVDFEMSEQAAQAVGKIATRMDQIDEKVKTLEATASKEKARADKAEEDLASETKARKEDSSDEKVQGLVNARVALITTATGILKDDKLKLDEMSDADIRTAVVVKVSPGAKEKLDAGDDAYLAARYDAAVESFKADEKDKPEPRYKMRTVTSTGEQRYDVADARQRMLETNFKMGREPIKPTAINQE